MFVKRPLMPESHPLPYKCTPDVVLLCLHYIIFFACNAIVVLIRCQIIHMDRMQAIPDSKVHGANMGPIKSRQDPRWPPVGPMNFAILDGIDWYFLICTRLMFMHEHINLYLHFKSYVPSPACYGFLLFIKSNKDMLIIHSELHVWGRLFGTCRASLCEHGYV